MRRKHSTLLMILGVLFLFGAGGWSYDNVQMEEEGREYSQEALVQIKQVLPEMEEKTEKLLAAASEPDQTALVEVQAQSEAIHSKQMQTITIEDTSYIGVVQVPSLGIELPVMAQLTTRNLRRAPCRHGGSLEDNSLIIAGHSTAAHFRALRGIQLGANVVFTDAVGNTILYQVSAIEILGSTDGEKLVAGEWDLTLYTCSPGAAGRVTVRCTRV